MINAGLFVAFLLCIPAANWMIGHVGACAAGPCLIPVGFGLVAPSGVLMIGLALVLRDVIQRRMGIAAALAAIIVGGGVSLWVAPTALAVASVCAFLFSEIADLAVYTPLQKKRLILAVLLSGGVGALADSALFLYIAFGSLDYVAGNTLGKLWMSIVAIPVIWRLRENNAR